MKEDKETAAA